jgi:hypothetical protein
MKTVRFSGVVARCGQPEAYTLWTAPESKREFQTSLKQHRVMTVHQDGQGIELDKFHTPFADTESPGIRRASLVLGKFARVRCNFRELGRGAIRVSDHLTRG